MYDINSIINKIICGDSMEELKKFPDECIDTVVTSPPYFLLRNYQTNLIIWDGDRNCEHDFSITSKKISSGGNNGLDPEYNENRQFSSSSSCSICDAWKGSLGLEPTPELFVKHLADIFSEVFRVLKPRGSCFVNIGDTYWNSGGGDDRLYVGGSEKSLPKGKNNPVKGKEYKNKCLCMIPERFAIEMISRGWILRNKIIWKKNNALPESVRDRFTRSYEYIYFFVKQQNYYFKQQFESTVYKDNRASGMERNAQKYREKVKGTKYINNADYGGGGTSFKNHSGNFKADGTRIGHDAKRNARDIFEINNKPYSDAHFATFPIDLMKKPIDATCPEKTGIVLDPFMGGGTVGVVAKKNNKNYIGIELNPEYIEIAEKRIFYESNKDDYVFDKEKKPIIKKDKLF